LSAQDRLIPIFKAAFPKLRGQVEQATRDNTEDWDSIATVKLAAMIEEEFEVSVDFDDAAAWQSFADVLAGISGQS
jgi:acyl carrier protein